jgi:putative ABC transport system permease protein
MAKTLGLAALTTIAALPLGLAVAWVLTAVINVEAFGWRLPVHFFPGQWVLLGLMALGTAFLAALWPTWQLRRASPLKLLQRFSNER